MFLGDKVRKHNLCTRFIKLSVKKMKKYYKIKQLILRYLHIYRNRKPSRDTQLPHILSFPKYQRGIIQMHFRLCLKWIAFKWLFFYSFRCLCKLKPVRQVFVLGKKKFLHCITNPSGLLYYSVWLDYTEISCTGGRFVEVSWTMYVCLPVLINIYKKGIGKLKGIFLWWPCK